MMEPQTHRPTIRLQARRKVLVVEDDPVWRHLLVAAVGDIDQSATIVSVNSVIRAQEQILAHSNFDLIISDLVLDEPFSGIDLWKSVRDYTPRFRFILISGKSMQTFLRSLDNILDRPSFVSKSTPIDVIKDKIKKGLYGGAQ